MPEPASAGLCNQRRLRVRAWISVLAREFHAMSPKLRWYAAPASGGFLSHAVGG
jgi:hypothetical protein